MTDLELETADRQCFPVIEPQIGLGRRLHLEAEHLTLHRQIPVELDLVGVEPDRQPTIELACKLRGTAGVVEVTVGVEDHDRP